MYLNVLLKSRHHPKTAGGGVGETVIDYNTQCLLGGAVMDPAKPEAGAASTSSGWVSLLQLNGILEISVHFQAPLNIDWLQ